MGSTAVRSTTSASASTKRAYSDAARPRKLSSCWPPSASRVRRKTITYLTARSATSGAQWLSRWLGSNARARPMSQPSWKTKAITCGARDVAGLADEYSLLLSGGSDFVDDIRLGG